MKNRISREKALQNVFEFWKIDVMISAIILSSGRESIMYWIQCGAMISTFKPYQQTEGDNHDK
jgi:spore cortex formation protein SpoVR/YcgB (stage V sporulation)